MKMMGWPSTIAGIAKAYEDFLNVLIVDTADEAEAARLNSSKLRVVATNTLMKSMQDKRELARFTLEASNSLQVTRA
jgi:2-phospho-L-lactate transferase/gluconeogenesis factor (CofD/UPF0052 family)